MASDVEIVNNALCLLGENTVTSLADNTVRARLASQFYGPTRDAVLRAHPWNCAVDRASLGLLSEVPVFGWKYQFTLPTDPFCLRVLALNDYQPWGDSGCDFKVEGRALLANTMTANIRFIGRITDPNIYDSLLYEAFSARLAAKLAYPITKSAQTAQEMMKLYEELLQQARSINGQEGSPSFQRDGTLLEVR